ncbi:MAG: hypothetical protein ABII93_01350 [Chrysiogenia bacterium]
MAALLGESGFCVDVADYRAKKVNSKHKYDLIISHQIDFLQTLKLAKPGAVTLFLASGITHHAYNRNIQKRYSDLERRRKCRLSIRQRNTEFTPFAEQADMIVGFGNGSTLATWEEQYHKPVIAFNNYGFSETRFVRRVYDSGNLRSNFLFFASWHQVGKGLDLLLEIFPKHPTLHLFVCSSFKKESDFCRCFRKELFETVNIHPVGLLPVLSGKFYDIVEKCAFVISPTAAEGQSGAILQCMATGLVPVVSREAGIDTEDFGFMLENCTLEEIEKMILQVSQLPAERIADLSEKTRAVCEEKYSETAFRNRWREIIAEIQYNYLHQEQSRIPEEPA